MADEEEVMMLEDEDESKEELSEIFDMNFDDEEDAIEGEAQEDDEHSNDQSGMAPSNNSAMENSSVLSSSHGFDHEEAVEGDYDDNEDGEEEIGGEDDDEEEEEDEEEEDEEGFENEEEDEEGFENEEEDEEGVENDEEEEEQEEEEGETSQDFISSANNNEIDDDDDDDDDDEEGNENDVEEDVIEEEDDDDDIDIIGKEEMKPLTSPLFRSNTLNDNNTSVIAPAPHPSLIMAIGEEEEEEEEDDGMDFAKQLESHISSIGDSSKSNEAKKHFCLWSNCVKVFSNVNDLVSHLQTVHLAELPNNPSTEFICEWRGCARKRNPHANRYSLIAHLRVHTGEKPFVCSVCALGFARSDALNKHVVKIHESGGPVGAVASESAIGAIDNSSSNKTTMEGNRMDESAVDLSQILIAHEFLAKNVFNSNYFERLKKRLKRKEFADGLSLDLSSTYTEIGKSSSSTKATKLSKKKLSKMVKEDLENLISGDEDLPLAPIPKTCAIEPFSITKEEEKVILNPTLSEDLSKIGQNDFESDDTRIATYNLCKLKYAFLLHEKDRLESEYESVMEIAESLHYENELMMEEIMLCVQEK